MITESMIGIRLVRLSGVKRPTINHKTPRARPMTAATTLRPHAHPFPVHSPNARINENTPSASASSESKSEAVATRPPPNAPTNTETKRSRIPMKISPMPLMICSTVRIIIPSGRGGLTAG
jgi:hypothetical protein